MISVESKTTRKIRHTSRMDANGSKFLGDFLFFYSNQCIQRLMSQIDVMTQCT